MEEFKTKVVTQTAYIYQRAVELQQALHPGAGDPDFVRLNRAFIYVRTPSIVASTWTVDEGTTRMLTESFLEG